MLSLPPLLRVLLRTLLVCTRTHIDRKVDLACSRNLDVGPELQAYPVIDVPNGGMERGGSKLLVPVALRAVVLRGTD